MNPRQAVVQTYDGLWIRLVDLGEALRARRYSAPLDVVVDVSDTFCPWNEGRWRLLVGGDGVAEIRRSDEKAQLSLDVADLAAAYLGGTTLAALHRAGRVTELASGAVVRTSRAFATDHAPQCPEGF